uniref:Uncharacterized protein n=1 Tax=Lactuca sativa TaxID=4236 RepID=A0A9R1UYY6_LACSA|nr:hypothetical protein LSAT_V11C700376910 [Lactuca sativa]
MVTTTRCVEGAAKAPNRLAVDRVHWTQFITIRHNSTILNYEGSNHKNNRILCDLIPGKTQHSARTVGSLLTTPHTINDPWRH